MIPCKGAPVIPTYDAQVIQTAEISEDDAPLIQDSHTPTIPAADYAVISGADARTIPDGYDLSSSGSTTLGSGSKPDLPTLLEVTIIKISPSETRNEPQSV